MGAFRNNNFRNSPENKRTPSYKGEIIGTSNLENQDPGMGIALGAFTPTPSYDRVRQSFRMFSEILGRKDGELDQDKLNEYYRLRDNLDLRLETSDGEYVPIEWIHVIDLSTEMGEYEIEVKIGQSDFAWSGE